MGCFLGCFGRRKNRRRQRRRESFQPRLARISEESTENVHLNLSVLNGEEVSKSAKDDHLKFRVPTVVEDVSKIEETSTKDDNHNFKVPIVDEVPKISKIPINDICDKVEEKNSPSPTRKRVTFDSNIKTYEHIAVEEPIELIEEKKPLKSRQGLCSSEGSNVTSNSSGSSYPSNHRYQNCRESDDEETDCDESDDDGDRLLDEDYYNDEYYDDKLQNWDNKVYTEEIADNVLDIERIEENSRGSNANARDRSGYVNAVLNPIENLTQWKAVKSRSAIRTQKQPQKENSNLISENQELKVNASLILVEEAGTTKLSPSLSTRPISRDEAKKQTSQEIAVDASLSTWLSTLQTTTSGCSSRFSIDIETCSKHVQSQDERPILGALTSDEIKQFSATNSPRKSPSRSPESPIIGTVGGYWNNHSMITSKYSEV